MDVRGSGQASGPLVRRAVGQVPGFEIVSLPVKVIGGFVILASFGVLTFVVKGFGAIGSPDGQGNGYDEQYDRCRANQACLQWSLAGSLPLGDRPTTPG